MIPNNINKLAIISGSGNLPIEIAKACLEKSITPYAIMLQDFVQEDDYHFLGEKIKLQLGTIKPLIEYLNSNNISHVIMAGGVKRPNLSSLKVDSLGSKLLAKILYNKFLGDDQILKIIAEFLEEYQITILSPTDILTNITSKEGDLTQTHPSQTNIEDINFAKEIIKQFGKLDIGQSIIVENKAVLGLEAAEGTDKLILRCGELKKQPKTAILIKAAKPTQDLRLDLPTIGPETVKNLIQANLAGIVIEAEKVIILDYLDTINLANKANIFITAIKF